MENLLSYGFLAVPAVFISLCVAGALIGLRWHKAGLAIALVSSLCLFAVATPALSSYLLYRIEAELPRNADLRQAQAIVVLGGDMRSGHGIVPDRLGPVSLQRLIFAAEAYRQLHLPVAVSGGPIVPGRTSQAELMSATLERDFGVPVRWIEGRSGSTWENAADTARILRPVGVRTVVLVTNAWHLPRALWAFDRAGFAALPWTSPRITLDNDDPGDFLPQIDALLDSFYAIHELIGGAYYRLRH
jgi:uncharacterized SAM-binding protein YcdF (DUF218 family)